MLSIKKTTVLSFALIVTSMVISSCTKGITQPVVYNEKSSLSTTTPEDTITPTSTAPLADVDSSTWKTYHNEEYSFEFKYPKKWSLVGFKEQRDGLFSIFLKTDYQPNLVDAIFTFESIDVEMVDILKKEGGFSFMHQDQSVLFRVDCGGAMACYVLQTETQTFKVSWDIQSSEKPPQKLDEIWRPSHNITESEVQSILKTFISF